MLDVIVIGGGPAGTAAAITAARAGARTLLLERGRFPRHKVCGEFVSPEAVGLLTSLFGGTSDSTIVDTAVRIRRARLIIGNSSVEFPLEPPAASIARYDLDAALWRAARAHGAEGHEQVTAQEITRTNSGFAVRVPDAVFQARAVIDASGRWSNLRPASGRPAVRWLGLKRHFFDSAPEGTPTTELYFFDGGYCGVQPIGAGVVNVCAMCRADRASSLEDVFSLHGLLALRAQCWTPAAQAVTTSPLTFGPPAPVRGGVLCAGDAAGFIDPFVGDGISLALRTGCAAAQAITQSAAVADIAARYAERYRREFAPKFRAAARMRCSLTLPGLLRRVVLSALRLEPVAKYVVRSTR